MLTRLESVFDVLLTRSGRKSSESRCRCERKEQCRVRGRRRLKIVLMFVFSSTALHWAARDGNDDVVEVLCAHQAGTSAYFFGIADRSNPDVNSRDYFSRTPLHYAAREGKVSTVRFLLSQGVRVQFSFVVLSFVFLHFAPPILYALPIKSHLLFLPVGGCLCERQRRVAAVLLRTVHV